jgi:RNA polymerase subunit RPABC4/transcription elongation factor Spt4
MAGTLLNWRVEEEIELAYDWDGEQVDNWPEDRIGDVAICEAKCGAIIRAEPYQPGRYYTQMVSNRCPCCNEIGFSDDWLNHWVVIDDTATKLKRRMRGSEEE